MRVTKLLLVSVWSAFGLSDVKPNQSNHNGPSAKKENTQNSQWELKVKKANRLKRGKTRATKLWLISVLLPIGWESRASYLDQSQSEVRQNQCNPGKISILSLKLLERLFNWLGDEQFSQLPRTFLPDYVCVRRHQPRPQREEDWKKKKSTTEKMKSRRIAMITASNHICASYPLLEVWAQSNTLCMAVTPSFPIGTISPPVIIP